MAIWKRKLKKKESEEHPQKEGAPEETSGDIPQVATGEETPAKEQPKPEEPIPEKPPEGKFCEPAEEYVHGGVFVFDKKISGFFGKGFWGILSVLIFPPVLVFALSILVIVCMLVFPLMAIVLIALIPAVFVTLSVLIIALPVLLPLLILFLLITGKGKLLIGSEGKWFGLEMFGKSYTLE
ncbi:MAG: hypothetical protein CV087_17775 [Candidatus Brocadia sp. WS118]|nr:MAG: hypothetical protein CV087_17775 [Candidatus Brocadia sp. WS118]